MSYTTPKTFIILRPNCKNLSDYLNVFKYNTALSRVYQAAKSNPKKRNYIQLGRNCYQNPSINGVFEYFDALREYVIKSEFVNKHQMNIFPKVIWIIHKLHSE